MDYREHPAPPQLGAHVQCVWHLRDAAPTPAAQTVYPDGRCELIVHRAQPMELLGPDGWQPQARTLFAAQSRRAIRLRTTGALDCVGVRLRPEASAALFPSTPEGATLADRADTVIDLRQLDAPFATALERSLDGDDASMTRFTAVLAARLARAPIDARVAAAVAALDRACGNLPLRRLAHDVGIGVRSLQARFVAAVGLTVKEYALVQRLQATIRQLDAGDGALAETALDMGFADQAHATRAVRAFAGLTPARLRRALLAERDGDDTLAMAAAFVRGRS